MGVDINIVFNQPLPSLLPFVPILQGGENESTIREALRIFRADEQLNQLETVLAFFATFVLESTLVQVVSNIEMSLEVKFGSDGLELMPQIAQISDLNRLQEILRHIVVANTIAELREVF